MLGHRLRTCRRPCVEVFRDDKSSDVVAAVGDAIAREAGDGPKLNLVLGGGDRGCFAGRSLVLGGDRECSAGRSHVLGAARRRVELDLLVVIDRLLRVGKVEGGSGVLLLLLLR